jgi:hypothetical protein
MWLRLRQIALVAEKLEPVTQDLREILGIEVCYRDPGVGRYGLENALFPVGNQFIEVVAPAQPDTAGGRYLARRGGDGGYMVITQCDDHAPRRARVAELGIRLVSDFTGHEFSNMQLHPKDTGGSFFEIDQQLGPGALANDGPWEPAGGDGWKAAQRLERVTAIAAAEVQCDDPEAVARRWAEIAQQTVERDRSGAPALLLNDGSVRFVPCADGRPEGLGGIDVKVANRAAVLEAAKVRGADRSDSQVLIGGMRVNLV